MKERPILFNAEMVRAILADRKTQTRRVMKWKPREEGLNLSFSGLQVGHYNTGNPNSGWVLRSRGAGGCWNDRTFPVFCPYGTIGDRLWVRETFYIDDYACIKAIPKKRPYFGDDYDPIYYRADGECCDQISECQCASTGPTPWRPSIHMPRWASRITLEITGVRVERLQDISEEDAIAEGFPITDTSHPHGDWKGYTEAKEMFSDLWDTINGKGSWDANPWVWVVDFKRVNNE